MLTKKKKKELYSQQQKQRYIRDIRAIYDTHSTRYYRHHSSISYDYKSDITEPGAKITNR